MNIQADISSHRPQSGGELFGACLAAQDVGHVYTLVGSHISALLAGCADAGIALIDTRHEASAGHAAEGYARATGRCAVCLVTAGPGFTNVLTPMANCLADGVPVLFVVGARAMGERALNPLMGNYSQIDVARPLAKWAIRADTPAQIPALLIQGLLSARRGRPGPVYLEIPVDVAEAFTQKPLKVGMSEVNEQREVVDPSAIAAALALLRSAQRPLLLAGGGVKYAGAAAALRELVAQTGLPVLTNHNAHGALTADDAAWCGPFSATLPAPEFEAADLLLVLGARFGLLTAGLPGRYAASHARIVQVDIEPTELRHLRPSDIPVVGDCLAFLQQLTKGLDGFAPQVWRSWASDLREARGRQMASWPAQSAECLLHPFHVARSVVAALPKETVFVSDGGDAKAWLEMNLQPQFIGQYLSRAYNGALGCGVGMAIGAQIAHPDKRVCLFIGDGAWGFYLQEVASFLRHALPIITVVVNNACWGSTRREQLKQWGGTRSLVTDLGAIRYDQIAAAFGCHAEYVSQVAELQPALQRALAYVGPSVINVLVDAEPDPTWEG